MNSDLEAVLEAIDELEAEGRHHIKASEIADRTHLSTKAVGGHIPKLEGDVVEKWTNQAPHTWTILEDRD